MILDSIILFLAADVVDIGNGALKAIAGSSITALVMYKWVLREADRTDKVEALREADKKKYEESADKSIVALTEVAIYMAESSKKADELGGQMKAAHESTRRHVTDTIKDIKEMRDGK